MLRASWGWEERPLDWGEAQLGQQGWVWGLLQLVLSLAGLCTGSALLDVLAKQRVLASFRLGAETFEEQLKTHLAKERARAVEANKVIRQAMKKRKGEDGEAAETKEAEVTQAAAATAATATAADKPVSAEDHLARLRAGKPAAT